MTTAPHKPVIVPAHVSSDWANRTYGEAYGVDWQYAPPDEATRAHVSTPWSQLPQTLVARIIDGEAYVRAADIPGYPSVEPSPVPPKYLGINRIKPSAYDWDEGTQTMRVEAPTLSEFIHPAHCEPEEDEEPPSEWRDVALYLAMAAIALIGVALLYGVAP